MAEVKAPEMLKAEDKQAHMEKLRKEPASRSSSQLTMTSYITNLTNKSIVAIDIKFWSGRSAHGPPNTWAPLRNGYTIIPIQYGNPPQGVKYGIVFADDEEDSPTRRKYVIAFDSAAQKVYAESGPIGPVDWNVVEDRLGKSGSSTEVNDHILGSKVVAKINGLVGDAQLY